MNLAPGANATDIKRAYRTLAKQYHPDRSGNKDTREKFIEVNEAYEVLLKKDEYIQDAIRRYKAKQGNRTYNKPRQQSSPRERAQSYADMRFKEFEKSPVYRTAIVMNSAFDYIFLGLGITMIISPFVKYYYDLRDPFLKGVEPEFQLLPIFMGSAFSIGIWYFIFKNKEA